ncbi:MAG: sulfatase family protein [Thermoleophilaceae bacterium]
MALTRRQLLETASATAVAAATLDASAFAQRPDGPNVLLIVVDTLRADHVGAYGGRARTPTIDALAREGLRFTRFYPEAMATVPARRSIMTGRRTFPFRGWSPQPELGLRHTPGWAPIAEPGETFTAALRRAGWWTGYVTDNPFLGFSSGYASFRQGFDRFVRVGGQIGTVRSPARVSRRDLDGWLIPELREAHIERRVRSFLGAGGRYWEDESRSWAARVSMAGAAVLDEAARRRPFALVVDTYEPHEPWTPPRSYVDLYGDPDHRGPEPCMSRYDRVADYLERARRGPVLRRMRDLYAAEVTMTDRWLGVLIERLYALGLERETVIALVADHGFLLGEHGWTGKIASMLHPELIHVPFVLVDPLRRRPGAVTGWLAQTHDIAPTLLELTGVRQPKPMNGDSLAPLLVGHRPRARRPMAYGGYANWHYARTDRWAFVAANTGRGRRLYDLERDPDERRNVARDHPGLIDELEERVRGEAGGRLPSYDGRGLLRRPRRRRGRRRRRARRS